MYENTKENNNKFFDLYTKDVKTDKIVFKIKNINVIPEDKNQVSQSQIKYFPLKITI